jgi:hypothetical protein
MGRVAQPLNCRTYRSYGSLSFAHVAKGEYRTAHSEMVLLEGLNEPVRNYTIGSIVRASHKAQGRATHILERERKTGRERANRPILTACETQRGLTPRSHIFFSPVLHRQTLSGRRIHRRIPCLGLSSRLPVARSYVF